MKRFAGKILLTAALAALAATTLTQAGSVTAAQPRSVLPLAAPAYQRPPAPEVWSFRVEYSERKSPQFPWGPWRKYTTITGDYATAKARAYNVTDSLDGRSQYVRWRIIEKRIR